MTRLIYGFEPFIKRDRLFFTTEIAVRVTFLMFRTQYFLTGFIDLVKCFLFAVSVPFNL